MLRPKFIVAAGFLLLNSMLALAQVQSSQNQTDLFADIACNSNICLRVVYSPSEKLYNMSMSADGGASQAGWYAVGTGQEMSGSNMMIGWININGNIVMSQRTASGHNEPTTSHITAAAVIDKQQSFSNSTVTVWAWSFPVDSSDTPSASTSFIWAFNKNDNPSDSPSSHLKRHTSYGIFSLDLTKPYAAPDSAASASNGTTAPFSVSPAVGQHLHGQSQQNSGIGYWLIAAHMVMMIVAWFLLVPAGILVGRFGRTMFAWFPIHRNIQIAASILVLVGFVVVLAAIFRKGTQHFATTHGKTGLAIFVALGVQIMLGVLGHRTERFRPSRVVHVIVGLIITSAAIWNSVQGFELWQGSVPRYVHAVLWIWAVLLLVAYLAGLTLLPRDLRQWRAAQASTTSEEKHEFIGLQQCASAAYCGEDDSMDPHSPRQSQLYHPGWGPPPLQQNPHSRYGVREPAAI